jgi:hypothetical protein
LLNRSQTTSHLTHFNNQTSLYVTLASNNRNIKAKETAFNTNQNSALWPEAFKISLADAQSGIIGKLWAVDNQTREETAAGSFEINLQQVSSSLQAQHFEVQHEGLLIGEV